MMIFELKKCISKFVKIHLFKLYMGLRIHPVCNRYLHQPVAHCKMLANLTYVVQQANADKWLYDATG
jgi:hypothetical protein